MSNADDSLNKNIQELRSRAENERNKKAESEKDYSKKLNELNLERQISDQSFRWQVIRFRKKLLIFLLIMMTCETVALFAIIVLASLPSKLLSMDNLTLQILVGATIAQISTMIIVIVRSVFAENLNKYIMSYQE